jgi:F-type H+-transporting ATPase subunit b
MDRLTEFTSSIGELLEQSLGIDTGQILLQWIATLILFVVVTKFLWTPLTNLLEQRQATIDNDLQEAQTLNLEAKKLKEAMDEQLLAAKEEAKNMIEAARKRAQSEREQLVAQVDEELASMRERASADLTQDIEKAKAELQSEVVNIAFLVAEKILQQHINQEGYQQDLDALLSQTHGK